eukprot:10040305-Alexandrium_andersonii.AAC.1
MAPDALEAVSEAAGVVNWVRPAAPPVTMHVSPGSFVGATFQYRLACASSGQDLLALADGGDVVSPDQVAL